MFQIFELKKTLLKISSGYERFKKSEYWCTFKHTVLPQLIFDDIPIVSSTKLLGVIIDNKLKFDLNSKDVTRRVAFKVRVLLKSAFLFDI